MNTTTNFRRGLWLQQNKRWAARTIMLLLLAGLPGVVRAQFNYVITNGTVTHHGVHSSWRGGDRSKTGPSP
jgi:hypothetical protein